MAPVHPVYDCIRRTCATSRSGPLVPPKRCCCLMKTIVYASPGPAHPIWVAAPHNTGHEELHTLRGQAPAAAVSRSAFTKILDIRLQVTLSKTIQGVDAKLNAKGLATRLSLSLPGQRAESMLPSTLQTKRCHSQAPQCRPQTPESLRLPSEGPSRTEGWSPPYR